MVGIISIRQGGVVKFLSQFSKGRYICLVLASKRVILNHCTENVAVFVEETQVLKKVDAIRISIQSPEDEGFQFGGQLFGNIFEIEEN